MLRNGIIEGTINNILSFFQNKFECIYKNSTILKNIDNLIYISIVSVFLMSLFLSSDILGFIALSTLGLTVFKLFVKKGEKLEMNLFEKFLLIYFLIVIISLAGSTLFHLSLKGFLKTFTYLGFYFSVAQYFKNNIKRIPVTFCIIALGASFEGILGLIQNFANVSEISTWQDVTRINPEEVMTRVYGTLQPYNPNLYGGYLVAVIPALLGCFFYFLLNKKYLISSVLLILTTITSISLILSGCRGAYIGLFITYLAFALFLAKFIWDNNYEKLKKIYISVIGAIIVLSTSAALIITPIRARIFSMFVMRDDSSTSFRFNVYQSAIQMAKDNWLLGIGVGNQNFREIYGLYMRTGFDALSSYSVYLELIVESGIFALLAFLTFLFFVIKMAFEYIFKNTDYKKTVFVIAALVSILSIMIHGIVDTIFFRPQVQFIFWTMVATISASLVQENN